MYAPPLYAVAPLADAETLESFVFFAGGEVSLEIQQTNQLKIQSINKRLQTTTHPVFFLASLALAKA